MTKINRKFLPDSINSLNSTEDFIRKLKEIKLEKDLKIVSFDIINLYPLIDTSVINQIIMEEVNKNYNNLEIKNTLIRINNLICNKTISNLIRRFTNRMEEYQWVHLYE